MPLDVNDDVLLDISAGDTAVFATDYVGSKHHPYAKLEFGADGTATIVSAANPLPSTDAGLGVAADAVATTDTGTFSLIALFKRSLQSLTSLIGNTGAAGVNIFVTPTVTAGAYTTGQVAGGKISVTSAVRASGGAGIIQAVSVSKRTALTASYDVIFFNADPTNTTFTDNAALAINVADLDKIIGVVSCNTLISLGTPQLLQGLNAALPFKLTTGTTLFAVLVIRGAETYATTTALTLAVDLLQA